MTPCSNNYRMDVVLVWHACMLSRVQCFVTPWTVVHQAPLSMGFSRQEYWSGLSFPSPGDIPDPGIERMSPALQAASSLSEPPGKPKMQYCLFLNNRI